MMLMTTIIIWISIVGIMRIKGMDKVKEKLPGFRGKRLALLFVSFPIWALISLIILILFDIIPRVLPENTILMMMEPLFPVIGVIIVISTSMWGIHSRWWKREEYRSKYGNLAYQKALMRLLPSVSMIAGIVIHSFVSIRSLPPVPPVNEITVLLSRSWLSIMGISSEVDVTFRVVASGIVFVIGLLMVRSAVITFGIDYMMVVYLFFPEESELQNNEIYSVIRHPAYFTIIILSFSGFLFRLSVYSFITVAIIVISLIYHLKYYEEKELIDRFGDSYIEYMRRVPALHVRLGNLRVLLQFILNREKNRQ